jgi:hypothetical protein
MKRKLHLLKKKEPELSKGYRETPVEVTIGQLRDFKSKQRCLMWHSLMTLIGWLVGYSKLSVMPLDHELKKRVNLEWSYQERKEVHFNDQENGVHLDVRVYP